MASPAEYTQNYPLFGRRLQRVPVYVDGYGLERRPLHTLTREETPAWWGEWQEGEFGWRRRELDISRREFISNLRNSRVDFVLSSKWDLNDWPPQQALLRRSPGAIEIAGDKFSSIWQIVPAN